MHWDTPAHACKVADDDDCWTGDFNEYHVTSTTYAACDQVTCPFGCINDQKC
jgi:hypothetical protein